MINYIVKVKLKTGKVVQYGFRARNITEARLISIDLFDTRVLTVPKPETNT